jgi:hypothetical protein
MTSGREATANRGRVLGLISSATVALVGCAHSVSTQTVKSPVLERRTQVNPSEPLLRSEWQVDGGRIVGRVMWGSCVSERSWSVDEQRVERVRPSTTAGLLAIGAGVAAIIGGLAAYSSEAVVTCTNVPGQAGYQSCKSEAPSNTESKAASVLGTAVLGMGVILLAVKPSDKVTVLKHEPHAEKGVSPCIAAEDLSVMSLLLKLGPNRFAHITVAPDGQASADLPPSARLPKGADLDVVVYRAPRALANALPRWTKVGQVHVPE